MALGSRLAEEEKEEEYDDDETGLWGNCVVRSESRLNSVSVSEGADLASSDRLSQFWPEAVSNSEIDDVASDVDIFFFLFCNHNCTSSHQ